MNAPSTGRPAVLVIAGTDSSGGAGLTRDVQVLTDFGIEALCVVTAVTAQSNARVAGIHYIPPEVIAQQIVAAFETRHIAAVKIGMLGTRATVEAVAAGLAAGAPTAAAAPAQLTPRAPPIVLDPVLESSSGRTLLDAGGRAMMREKLFPLTLVATPNVPEAAALLGEVPWAAAVAEVAGVAEAAGAAGVAEAAKVAEAHLMSQAERLLALGPQAILLKGGHAEGPEAIDLLVSRDLATRDFAAPDFAVRDFAVRGFAVRRLVAPRIRASHRGTGCALSSAIAAGLARGVPLDEACQRAKSYVVGMLQSMS